MPKRKNIQIIHPLVNSKRKASQESRRRFISLHRLSSFFRQTQQGAFSYGKSSSTQGFLIVFILFWLVRDPMWLVQRLNSSLAPSTSISCTTFNILAPIYKRVDQLVCLFVCFFSSSFDFPKVFSLDNVGFLLCVQNQSIRESHFRALWFTRNQKILDLLLLHQRSSVICLQVNNKSLKKSTFDSFVCGFKRTVTVDRKFGLRMRNWWTCTMIALALLATLFSSCLEQTVVVMVSKVLPFYHCFFFVQIYLCFFFLFKFIIVFFFFWNTLPLLFKTLFLGITCVSKVIRILGVVIAELF